MLHEFLWAPISSTNVKIKYPIYHPIVLTRCPCYATYERPFCDEKLELTSFVRVFLL